MKLHATLVLATVSVSSLILGGCEDSSARQRDQVQAQLAQAKVKLSRAMVGAPDEAGPALQMVVTDLSRVEGGEPGQQAAKSLLTATALREVAAIKLAAAEEIEANHRMQRNLLHAKLDAAVELMKTAAALESVDAVAERQQLQREIESARAELAELRAKLEQLDGPISERAMQNANSKSEVDALRLKVNELRRRAQELGHADGFETYREAVEISRQADQIEYEMAQREIDLEHSLTPELTMTDAQAQQIDALIESLETARAQLEAFASATAEKISDIRKQVAEYASLAGASVNEMNAQRSGELAALYGEAQAALEKAATQARSAASQRSLTQDDLQSARLAGVQAQEMLGRLHWENARGLQDHLYLVQRVAALPGADAALTQAATELTEQHKEALEQARAAYEAAQEQAANVQSRSNPERIDALNQSIERAIAALSGQPTTSEMPQQSNSSPSGSVSTPSVEGAGFATPEEAVESFKALLVNVESIRTLQAQINSATRCTTPQCLALRSFVDSMTPAVDELFTAMTAKFGREPTMQAFKVAGMELAPDLSTAQLKRVGDDQASVTYTRANGTTKTQWLIKVDDRWYFDGDKLDLEDQQALAMKDMIGPAMIKAMTETAKAVAAGTYATAQEAVQAMQQGLMSAMSGGLPQPDGK